MAALSEAFADIRSAMAKFPLLGSHNPSVTINREDIYFPLSHAEALDPDRAIVIGNRGMGKSFWSNALINADLRSYIQEGRPGWWNRRTEFSAFSGFVDPEGAGKTIASDTLQKLSKDYSPDEIWRAVVLEHLLDFVGVAAPASIHQRVLWVHQNPEKVREIFTRADQKLSLENNKYVFIFDQLDRLSPDSHETRRKLTEGILRLALAFKSYRNLRLKVFMRPDHYLEETLFQFPDASKIRGESVDLLWTPTDLYGLFFQKLKFNSEESFKNICRIALEIDSANPLFRHRGFAEDASIQHALFDVIAGSEMGSKKRGRPYVWLITHLADARNQVSPRTFLRALRYSADRPNTPIHRVIDHLDLHEGVRRASENRVEDLKEDYPWVQPALIALQGLSVPCTPEEMIEKWRSSAEFVASINKLSKGQLPSGLEHFGADNSENYRLLIKAMAQIGVVEQRITTGKVNIPDIFRLGANLKRRGGVTPQQRQKIRKVSNVFD